MGFSRRLAKDYEATGSRFGRCKGYATTQLRKQSDHLVAETKEKTAEEGGTRRGRIQLEPSGTSGLCLGITWHPMTKLMLYLCDNQALLKAVKRWVGEGGKATLAGAPDADILIEAIEELRKRTTAGAATFLVKVKAHRGEPANEEADIQADKAISGKDVPTEWHDRTNRAVFTRQEPRWKDGGLKMINWELQSKTPPQSPHDAHIYCISLIRIAFCHVSKDLPLWCLFFDTMNICF